MITVIAEAGVNHNGDVALAERLVDEAALAGADVVKFQTFVPEEVISQHVAQCDYQKANTGEEQSMLDMVRALHLDEAAHRRLMARCHQRGIRFMSTPFDLPSVALLTRLGVDCLKIPSGEITNPPLLLAAARTGKPVILSSGMSTLAEVQDALGVLAFGWLGRTETPSAAGFQAAWADAEGQALVRERAVVLHCTTEYPAPFAHVNLRAMDTMAAAFGVKVGFSDHTPGIAMPIAAAARGAVVVEKHFTLDRTLPGPDHKASLEPDELKAMVQGIRAVEEALGDGRKVPAPSEIKYMAVVRKCLVARTAIRAGEPFTEANLAVKRAGGSQAPGLYWQTLGRPAGRDYAADEAIEP